MWADLGEIRLAIEYYERGLAIARGIGDRQIEGEARSKLGRAYRFLGAMERDLLAEDEPFWRLGSKYAVPEE